MQLNLRSCIAFREEITSKGRIIYLSLLNSEIDIRFSKFINSIKENIEWLSMLELTDAVIQEGNTGEVIVYRGGGCTFPMYWTNRNNQLYLSSQLPISEGKNFSKNYLISFFSNLYLQSSYEPNSTTHTPLDDWKRIRRGAVTKFIEGKFNMETPYLHKVNNHATIEQISNQIKNSFDNYGSLQNHSKKSILELSGGFDSTLAASTAPNILSGMKGISVEFPYYEFRYEPETQIAVGNALGIDRIIHDGRLEFPYTPAIQPPKFDEPTVFVTGLRHVERVASLASDYGASFLYVGHGGDQLFATDLLNTDPVSDFNIEKNLFDVHAIHTLKSALNNVKNSPWLQRETACFVYDACIDVWVKEMYGLTVRTPFTDLSLFKAALEWSHWCKKQAVRPDKSILAKSMQHLIPEEVLNRKGKVSYDGVWLRGYTQNADHIANQIEQTANFLEYIGVSPAWLLHRIKQITEWQDVSTKEILAVYAISNWLLNHNMHNNNDVGWVD